MNKYKLIIADTTNPTYSKMSAAVAQAIAVGFGFANRNFTPRLDQVLTFDFDTKEVDIMDCTVIPKYVVTAISPESLLNALQNPEAAVNVIKSKSGNVTATVWENSVTFHSPTATKVGTVTVPKEFIREVVGNDSSTSLPVVCFRYNSVYRTVEVTRMDDYYIQGFETARDQSRCERTFKKYCINKLASAEVQLVSYNS